MVLNALQSGVGWTKLVSSVLVGGALLVLSAAPSSGIGSG
jgi:hypothetical protein